MVFTHNDRHHQYAHCGTDLTGSAPHLISDSPAGLSHSWKVKTTYYEAEIPIWIDEIADAEAWKEEFLKPEAKEVLEVLGAVVVCFRKPVDGEALVPYQLVFQLWVLLKVNAKFV